MRRQRSDAKYDPNYVGPKNNIKKLLNGNLIYLRSNKDPITGIQSITEFEQKPNETVKQFMKRIGQLVYEGRSTARIKDKGPADAFNKTIQDWTDNWFKENFKAGKYGPRESNKFLDNLKNDWSKEVKEKGYKKVGIISPSREGYPNIFKRIDRFYVGSFPIDNMVDKAERNIRKGFYENQLKTNPGFKSELKNYFNYFIRNKTGEANQALKVIVPPSSNAVYLLSDDSGVTGVGRTDMFSKIPEFTKDFNKYQQKFSKRSSSSKNLATIEKALGKNVIKELTGYDTVQALQRAEGKALKKLFDVSQLPNELLYSVEHAQGLATAARSGNKNLMKAAMTDLAGMTRGRNIELGWSPGIFESTRKTLVNQIQDGLANKQNMNKKVKELNDFIFAEYKQDISKNKKPYSIVGNKLQTSIISQATNQDQRFGQYFNQLAANPESSQNLLKQIETKPELTKFVQEGTDPILKSLRTTVINLAKNNKDNFCNILSMRKADGGRMGFATGGNCATQVAAKFDENPVKFAQDVNKLPYAEGPLNKAKNSATKFLQSPMLRGAGKYGAIAAGGAVAAGFVKKFMNDDPTTYLSNEEQQKNLLMDMVTGSLDDTPEESPAIGDAYLPALGAATVAGTAVTAPSTIEAARSGALGAKKSGITKTALKTLGKGLAATTTPIGLLATEPLYLADQIQQGDSLGEIATNPFNYMGAAFVGPATEFATKGGLSPMIAKTMRLGISPNVLKTVSRRFGLPGLALSLGISGYETYDDFKNKRGFFSDEE